MATPRKKAAPRRAKRPQATRPPVRPTVVRAAAPPTTRVAAVVHRGITLTARDIMRRDVITIDRAAPLSEIERILTEAKISGAPVTDETGAIVGVVSMRDLVDRYVEDSDARPRRGKGYFEMSSEELLEDDYELTELPEESEETAEDVMTAEVHSVPEDAPVAEVARVMVKHRIHRVLVQAGGHFAGIVGTFEILDALAQAGKRPKSTGRTP